MSKLKTTTKVVSGIGAVEAAASTIAKPLSAGFGIFSLLKRDISAAARDIGNGSLNESTVSSEQARAEFQSYVAQAGAGTVIRRYTQLRLSAFAILLVLSLVFSATTYAEDYAQVLAALATSALLLLVYTALVYQLWQIRCRAFLNVSEFLADCATHPMQFFPLRLKRRYLHA